MTISQSSFVEWTFPKPRFNGCDVQFVLPVPVFIQKQVLNNNLKKS